ncbi:RHS repeat-associated core domain-containing protein [Candidatus Methylomicrobium oryzae]|uniref:RHS repeat-associated core domain-containing protein n=1 Tax=Candidatus Methylomicrobium oryzae TaxID=2802053 RepID=UPI0019243ED4|nr:RHS repeat-associated core domain-containing protein [Methylomicrobium sp. RS1]MBL1265290.1 RHS repeat protein [Methylomicrobium sp. RS1]
MNIKKASFWIGIVVFTFYHGLLTRVMADTTAPLDSTSPNAVTSSAIEPLADSLAAPAGSTTITFSEFPVGTQISNQYQSVGILFGGDAPFITADGANPTSPVLAGTPKFFGAVEGTFVYSTTGQPVGVSSFSLDAGYFDNLNSTKLTWYDASGNILGSQLNAQYGIQTFNVSGANIVRWRLENASEEPAGFGVDNLTFVSPPAAPPKDSDNNGKPDCPAACAGDPINVGTGNEYQSETDFELPAHTGLSLTRFYNSQDTGSTPFGANWQSTWHRTVRSAKKAATATFIREDGRTESFTQNASGDWLANPSVNTRLTALYNKGGHHQTGWQVKRIDDSTETYSFDGQLLSITTREGLTTSLAYDNKKRLDTVTGPFGHTLTFTYDPANHVASVRLPSGKLYNYGYDADNNLTTVTYPDNTVRQYIYNEPANTANTNLLHALTGIIDENNKRYATFQYDNQGRAVSTQRANGVELTTVAYNNDGTVSVTDALGHSHTFNLTTTLGVVKPTAISGAPIPSAGGQAFTFDLNGNVASRLDFNGNLDCHAYDLTRNLETARVEGLAPGSTCPANIATYTPAAGSAERVILTQWHPRFRLPTQITEPSGVTGTRRVTAFTYDDVKGTLLAKTLTAGALTRSWTYTYNSHGQVLTIDGPRMDVADITTFTYDDATGNLATLTNALDQATQITAYNADGSPLAIQDPNGLVQLLTYNEKGQIDSLQVGNELTTYAYDPANQLKKVTLPDGSFLAYRYNDAHQLIGLDDKQGNHIDYTPDLAGNILEEQVFDPNNTLVGTKSHVYDEVNRLAKDIGALDQTTVYERDGNGNIRVTTDPNTFKTQNSFDALNRLATRVDHYNGETRFDYNPDDSIAKMTDPRDVATQYGYDGLGNQISVQSPDSGTTIRTFDEAGNIKTSTDARSKTTTYFYDALNRLTRKAFADGTAADYFYDQGTYGIGHLTALSDPSGSTAWTYDQRGYVLTKVQTIGNVTLTTANTYDTSTGKLATTTLPSGQMLAYQYDANGKPASITAGISTVASEVKYLPFGAPLSWLQGNGAYPYLRQFDLDGNLSEISFRNTALNTSQQTIRLFYDPASRLYETQDDAELGKTFDYNALNALIFYASANEAQNYEYDPSGNRTLLSSSLGTLTNYTTDTLSNRLLGRTVTNQPAVNYLTDESGNITSDGARSFVYNAAGQLASATMDGITTQYAYNGAGERVRKSNLNETVLFIQDAAGNLIGEYDGSGQPIQETIYLGNLPVGILKGGMLYYVNPDQLGAPRTITKVTGTPVWTWNRDPFGNGQPTGTLTYHLRLPGQYYDAETGLHHNGFRDYDPTLGRYLQSDPIGLEGGINTYAYVNNNPVNLIDTLGLQGEYPPLQRIHPESTIMSGSNRFSYEFWNKKSTDELVNSLCPGSESPLTTTPDGRIFNGNVRILILEQRGYDVNSLPRDIYSGAGIPEPR